MLCDLSSLERHDLRDRLDDTTKKLQQLQKFLSDSFTFLPSYDVKHMQSEISRLQKDLNEKRSSFMPKKKFAFSKKKQSGETREMDSAINGEQVQWDLGLHKEMHRNKIVQKEQNWK